MKTSDELHRLIHSLSKPEKRMFRLFASRYDGSEKSNYIKLFEAIEKQPEYDEEVIKKQFRKEKFIKHLPSEKNYLTNLVLESLFIGWSTGEEEQKLRTRMEQASMLMQRGLTEQAEKLLRKVTEGAEKLEIYPLLLDAIQLEKQLLSRRYFAGTRESDLENMYRQEDKVISLLRETNEYWLLFSRFYRIHYLKGNALDEKARNELESIMHHPLLQEDRQPGSFRTRLDYLHIHALYRFMRGELESALDYNRQYLELLESQPDRIRQYAKRYLATLNNYLMDSLGLKHFADVEEGIKRLKSLPEQYTFYKTRTTAADIFRLSSMLSLNLYIKTGRFTEGINEAREIAQGLEEYGDLIVRHNRYTLWYQLAYVHFGAGQYSEAIKWLSNILNEPDEHMLEDLPAFARLFSLVIHYELGNTDLLEYLVLSAGRYMARRENVYAAEEIFLRHFKKLIKLTDSEAIGKRFTEMRLELSLLTAAGREARAFDYFDFLSWIDGKGVIAGKPVL